MLASYTLLTLAAPVSLFFVIKKSYLVVFMLLYPAVFIWQGLDVTDMGYSFAQYQQFLSDPQSIAYWHSFSTWLSILIGAIWLLLFQGLGVIGLKLAYLLIIYLTILLVFFTLKPYLQSRDLLIGLSLALIFITKAIGMWLNYNNLTALFFLLSAFLLVKAIKQKNYIYLSAGAFVLGLNVFIRLPNLLGLVLCLPVFFFGYLNHMTWRDQVKQALLFILGFLLAILSVFSLMWCMGHLDFYISAIQSLVETTITPTSYYPSQGLLLGFVLDNILAIATAVTALVFAIIAANKLVMIERSYRANFILGAIIILSSIGLLFHSSWRWPATGLLYLALFFCVAGRREVNDEFRTIALISLLLLVIIPLGSNTGIFKAVYGMWLAIPIAYGSLSKLDSLKILKLAAMPGSMQIIRKLILGIFIFHSCINAYAGTYRDAFNRVEMRHTIDHHRLRAVLTTEKRAKVLQELLDELSNHIEEDEIVFAYEDISLVYFLTRTRPYLYNSRPMLYEPGQFQKALARASEERTELPLIVRAKASTMIRGWPDNIEQGLTATRRYQGCRKVADAFVNDKRYRLVWQNAFFEIWLPPNKFRENE